MDNLEKEIQFIKECPHYTVFAIDLFCGAGGETTGIETARLDGHKCAKVIACVNHDETAIKSHAANHKDTLHYTEDIRTLNMGGLEELSKAVRLHHPNSYLLLHASLECTNFSKAKGGMPRDADSRTLAEHLFRYIKALRPDYIQIENVEEFMSWGDMDEHGHPISKDKGRCYLRWIQNVQRYGYDYHWRLLNAADYGAYTSRKRFFGQFAKNGLPITFPEATHSKDGDTGGMFGDMKKWKPVKEVLDFEDEGESIFGRKKPLVEKTLERIYAGLIKFVAGMSQREYLAFIDKRNSLEEVSNQGNVRQVHFLSKQFSGNPADKNISIDGPAGTLTCIDHHALVGAEFLSAYYGNGYETSTERPCPTIPTKDRFQKIKPCFLDMQYGNGTPSSTEAPSPTVCTNPKQALISVEPFIVNYRFNNTGSSVEEPAPTICTVGQIGVATCDKFLMNPQFASKGGSVDDPCFTLIARMDKMPPYLISTEEGGIGIGVYETDSPMTRKIKQFMALYNIIDIKMRMLKISELKKIMGFPVDYILKGSQAEQKKFIGNAVEVGMARVLCEALCARLDERERRIAV